MGLKLSGEATVSRELLREARELLVSFGDYVGNVDPKTGIDRCRVVAALLEAHGPFEELEREPAPGAETRPMHWHPRFGETNGCALCGERLGPNPRQRYIHVGQGGASILRADLPTVEGRDGVMLSTGYDTGDMGWFEVGDGCARKLGAEWSKELPPIELERRE